MNNKIAKIAVYVFLLIVAIGLLIWWLNYNFMKSRDYERLAEMKVLQAQMIDYYRHFNTYQIDGCQAEMPVNLCVGAAGRQVAVDKLIDPINKKPFQYLVNELTDNDFSVRFSLETSVAGLPAGQRVLTKNGIE